LPVPAPALPDPAASLVLRGGVVLALVGALVGLDWLAVAPNRLLPGQPVSAWRALALGAALIPALAAVAEGFGLRGARVNGAVLLVVAIAIAWLGSGIAAADLVRDRPASARVILGPGFWIVSAGLLVLAVEQARAGPRWLPAALALSLALLVWGGFVLRAFDQLSLVVEYRARAEAVHDALWQHLALAAAARLIACAVTGPLGWAAFRSPRVETLANAALGITQVTPAIALFGLLIPLLAALVAAVPALRDLGIGAIGPAPALIGVAAYLALPLLRGLVSGLRSADPAAVEAARAMGFTEGRITREVRIPLALPVLVGALRVAAVQSIGLVTLGGLIGAGGLGAIVFEGMAQFASDLILLGALPVVALALLTDGALAAAVARLEGRRR